VNELHLSDDRREPGAGAEDPPPRTARWRPALDHTMLPADLRALIGGGIVLFILIFWAVDDGGFDPGTWYWGALLALACLAGIVSITRGALSVLPRSMKIALVCFGLYVGWSYLSMTWAAYPGLALEGSNRTLLYFLVFTLMAILPWRRQTALIAICTFATAIGVIAIALLVRFSVGDNVPALFLQGRLVYPTGYINSTAALFTIGALVAIALAAHRQLPGALRGLLLAFAAADLMLAVTVQSRGWLFTLPIVALYSACVAGRRLRCVAAVILPVAGTLAAIHPLLRLYEISQAKALTHAAVHAGKIGLLSCAAVFALGTLGYWVEAARGRPALGTWPRRGLGTLAVALAGVALVGGLLAVSHGQPGSFLSRQWHGFTHEPTTYATDSHFDVVGSGRYDIWRSALKAFSAHPIGGLGQDNFGDWYLTHRHTTEEPLWTHSLELRLLAHTGIVGLLLFMGFLIAAFTAALAARRRGGVTERMLIGAALLPLGVWFIHGSIDWFWEVPALSGPALGFLAMAGRLRLASDPAAAGVHAGSDRELGLVGAPAADPAAHADAPIEPGPAPRRIPRRRVPRPVAVIVGGLALGAATIVLGIPYLAVRELNLGVAASHTDTDASLADFRASHRLNPLMSDPGVLGGTVALVNGRDAAAAAWFRQAVSREPGQWFGWLGRGLADSAQGEVDQARRSFAVAMRLDSDQLAVRNAAKLVATKHPLTASEALAQINYLP
jgi:hypothetical protein